MNFVLSILVCLAMVLGGNSALPAEPEAATTWTVRNLALTMDGETVTLAPEARFTAAVGTERAALAFDVASGGETYLPLAAELTEDALRFSFGAQDRAYTLTAEDFEQALDFSDPSTAAALDDLTEYVRAASALLARQFTDPAFYQEYHDATWQALFDTCRTSVETTEVEVDGETLPAERSELALNAENRQALADALTDMDSDLAEFAEAAQALRAQYGAASASIPDMRETVTLASREGLEYTLIEATTEAAEQSMIVREEVVDRDGQTDANLDMQFHLPGGDEAGAFSVMASAEISTTGPANAPETAHMAMEVLFAGTTAPAEGETAYDITNNTLRLELDTRSADGPGSGALRIEEESSLSHAEDEETRPESNYIDNTAFDLRWDGRAEDDGSDTWAVALAVDGEDALSFELNRAEGADVPSLAGRTELAFDLDALNGISSDDNSLLINALGADVSQLMLDASLLSQDAGGADLIGLLAPVIDSDDYERDNDDGDYNTATVDTLEEAAAIFEGEVPDYRPLEGWELTQIEAAPAVLYLSYEETASGREFCISAVLDYGGTRRYVYRDGALEALDAPVVEVYDDGDSPYVFDVWTEDGAEVSFLLYDDFSDEELAALISGLWAPDAVHPTTYTYVTDVPAAESE